MLDLNLKRKGDNGIFALLHRPGSQLELNKRVIIRNCLEAEPALPGVIGYTVWWPSQGILKVCWSVLAKAETVSIRYNPGKQAALSSSCSERCRWNSSGGDGKVTQLFPASHIISIKTLCADTQRMPWKGKYFLLTVFWYCHMGRRRRSWVQDCAIERIMKF